MTLEELSKALFKLSKNAHPHLTANPQVSLVTSDSRKVEPGCVFVALVGYSQDGHDFLAEVEKQGAIAIVGEEELKDLSIFLKIPYFKVKDSREALGLLASQFYGNPSHELLMVGVTGTSGKTTTSAILESILKAGGYRVGVIGTLSIRFENKVIPAELTTPDSVTLQSSLRWMRSLGCTAIVMEVSSHALKQKRTANTAFDGVIFTNLSPEHLDFHGNMEDYFQSKSLLFTKLAEYSQSVGKQPLAAINQDDESGRRLLAEVKLKARGFTAESPLVKTTVNGIRGQIDGIQIHSELTGQFNVSNLSAAVTLAGMLGIPPSSIQEGIALLKTVPGRLEKIENSRGIHVWVDYAHKPDALQKVLESLRQVKGAGRLITVMGCGGDRDRQKRPQMGKIAVSLSEHVFVTSDNPRTEAPEAIIQEILVGIQETRHENFTIQRDRKKAIYEALHFAKENDLVLVAGKGHETYQIIGKQKVHFDDREVINAAFLEYESWKA